jgi:alginate O-acetyltransferase complex protein AlgI
MLFNSQEFLLLFLPLTLAAYYACASRETLRLWVLAAASLVFYGYWDPRFVPLLVVSVVLNWGLAALYHKRPRKAMIVAGVGLNLAIIGFFKYTNFFVGTLALYLGRPFRPWDIILPLGISFFTFQQISYIVDLHQRSAPAYPFHKYALYVIFFPQLIAGPIVRHNEIIDQYGLDPCREGIHERLARGLGLLAVGLFKKVILADKMAETATWLFKMAAAGHSLSFYESWLAAGTYALQIYYDFSGYSDMAIGLGALFGFTIPQNFNAPYRAVSVRDFWRRWHMTLSRFLRDYLYIPLGGNRFGLRRQMAAVLITMGLGGLWHGAGWTFVVWGLMHGCGLAANHLWSKTGLTLPKPLAWILTLLFVVFGWVVFRADRLDTAGAIMLSMIGANGFSLDLSGFVIAPPMLYFSLPALLGPTSQELIFQRLRPRPAYAAILAVALFLLALRIGDAGYSEFIYFQF